ncbi:CaiB/BaiF CoA-transferase family protein [Acidithrix sp. C25]|uniref:CaiB/BaiF CoA transferase family protein n=1 Tax=Acidithrix sp. C25 TaxID=1671482 RepID=UPI00191BADB4|nr:CaiB/BaiF CoA-transferase family protein [Acidithrix sp. C25]CAG4904034.1 unnamed protein product [Acidithrix sp. C25]
MVGKGDGQNVSNVAVPNDALIASGSGGQAMISNSAPLLGFRVLEFAGIGPGPFCGMLLADLGATVVRVDRAIDGDKKDDRELQERYLSDVMGRSKLSIDLNLKDPASRGVLEELIAKSDVLLEGYRPGVMERLELGPLDVEKINPTMIYARMTGWGQSGPLSARAGHDMNYISLAGILSMIGPFEAEPVIPLNLVGDFGGGGMFMAFSIAAALAGRALEERFMVIDTAMFEGAATLASMIFGMRSNGSWIDERDSNLLDGGAPFYSIYRCKDGGYVGVGALEPQFYATLIDRLGQSENELFSKQYDKATWPAMRSAFSEIFLGQNRSYFEELLGDIDACTFGVFTPSEAIDHPHSRFRGSFSEVGGVSQPSPGPIFNATRPSVPGLPPYPGRDREKIMEIFQIQR